MKLPLIIVVLLLAGGGTTAYLTGVFDGEDAAAAIPENGLFTVRRGQLTVTVTENGTLVAKESAKIKTDLRGQAKITFLIEEGTQVEEGIEVARLDATSFEENLEEKGLDVVKAEADLDTAETDLEIQKADNEATIQKAEIADNKARKERERYIEGDAPKERRRLEVSIKTAETNFTRAKKRFEDSQLLQEREYINKSQLEEDEISYEQRTVELESAQRDLELFEQYTFPMTLAERDVAVSDGRRGLDTSALRAKSTLRQREVNVDQYQKRLDKLNDQVDELTEQISNMVLSAPSPGIVIYGDPQRPWERDRIRVGGEIWGQFTVLTIPDLRIMEVKIRIHEADISKLAVGLAAKVSMDTYPGLVLDGTVTKIGAIASGENPWDDDPEVKKFDVDVTLDTKALDVELKPGISAKAEVFIDRREDVIYIPIQCVFLEEGEHWVYRLDAAGQPEKATVEPGMSNDVYIEVLEGLDEGDRVLLYNPNLGSESSEEKEPTFEGEEDVVGDDDAVEDTGEEASDADDDAEGDDGIDDGTDDSADDDTKAEHGDGGIGDSIDSEAPAGGSADGEAGAVITDGAASPTDDASSEAASGAASEGTAVVPAAAEPVAEAADAAGSN